MACSSGRRAAAAHDLPSVISFTVETDGRLPSGEELGDAVRTVDEATGSAPAYYMVNCAHPTHVDSTLLAGDGWNHRLRGLRANASRMSHEELDRAETLDRGLEVVGVLETLHALDLAGPTNLLGLALRSARRDDCKPARQ